ncbi:MAG: hypothetical protein LBQ75_04955 [Zoogloeaceae bacterium]|jgi:HPt (histidine-containing phosphotransfer) domain-containing protein/HAMP domain-containing protein|nr:hypothetical protein [Zoogloeaceae bacterium]
MNNSRFRWEKILFSMGLAFLLVFILFSCAIVWSVIHEVEKDAEFHLYGVAAINEAKMNGVLSMSYETAVDAATSFASLERLPAAKRRSEGNVILTWMLNNSHVFNAWVAYEPNRFDGEDATHGGEYPGAPSGRYIRSYAHADAGHGSDDSLKSLEDMNEETLNDPAESDWYTTPLSSGKVYNDFNTISPYDYQTGEGEIASITISSPILHAGKPVGVVGVDVLARDLTLSDESNRQIVTAVFSTEGRLILSRDIQQIGTMIQDMGFSHFDRINQAMREGQEVFLRDEFSWFLGADALTYLKPVRLENFDGQTVYLYAALPTSVVDRAIFFALRPIAISLAVVLFAFIALLFFIAHHVINPLNRLMQTMDTIAGMGIVRDFPYLKREDEIGDFARSIARLWGYFRMRLYFLHRVKIRLENYLAIKHAIHSSLSFEEASKCVLRLLRVCCKADTAQFFISLNGKMRLFVISGRAGEFHIQSVAFAPEFEGQEILAEALAGKRYLLLNPYAMRALGLEFIAPQAWSVCILPIRDEKQLRAFVILETGNSQQVILHDDMVLTALVDRLTEFFVRHAPVSDVPAEANALQTMQAKVQETLHWPSVFLHTPADEESPESGSRDAPESGKDKKAEAQQDFLNAARDIPGLEVGKALSMLGNNVPLYIEMLTLSAKELTLAMDNMREFLASGDIHAFAIKVHGSKGALNAIGAFSLGDTAYQLEMSAKKEETENCRLAYPQFEQNLSGFVETLQKMLHKDSDSPRATRQIEDLADDLKAVHAALEDYNLTLAIERLRHAMRFSHAVPDLDDAAVAKKLDSIMACLGNIEYEEAGAQVQELLLAIGKGAGAGAAA